MKNRITLFRLLRWLIGLAIVATVVCLVTLRPLPFYLRGLYILILCCFMCLFRILKGPSAADRILSTGILGILIVGFCAILSIHTGRDWYIDIAIAWALQSFIGTLALAKYLEGKGLDE